jgi:hypothetical protein
VGRQCCRIAVKPYRGRTALLLRDGAPCLRGSHFQNGTIEFDIVLSEASGSPGIAFRAATHADCELFRHHELHVHPGA